ncbi:MAG: hypothetical protein CMM28_08510 [Rhodospirillaceae bacterium]|nr:hypothetical protein [Rhodospirillaceae bacterium]
MCTLIILRRPKKDWPVLIAANRDEMKSRLWDPPARHWPDRPDTVAGRDRLAGGSWLGHNDHGIVAAILNRHGTLGPANDKRSRGELVLDALEHANASDAAEALCELNTAAYRSFNLIIADNREAWWISNPGGTAKVKVTPIPDGISMFTSYDINDTKSARIAHYLPQFENAMIPDPDKNNWQGWCDILGNRALGDVNDPTSAMCIDGYGDYGTVSSSLVAIARPEKRSGRESPDKWLFASGPARQHQFTPINL